MEDEDVIIQGSQLHRLFLQHGLVDELEVEDQKAFAVKGTGPGDMQEPIAAPDWTVKHIDVILKSGLLLDDHYHLVDCFRPLQLKPSHPIREKAITYLTWMGIFGSFAFALKGSSCRGFLLTVGTLGAAYLKYRLKEKIYSKSLGLLTEMVQSLEKYYISLRKLLILVQQNDIILNSFKLRKNQIDAIKVKLGQEIFIYLVYLYASKSLIESIPLNRCALASGSFTKEDFEEITPAGMETLTNLDNLKKLFHSCILVQSEFLERLALCYCPELWVKDTVKVLCTTHKNFSEMIAHCNQQSRRLNTDYVMFRAVAGEYNTSQGQRKLPTPTATSPLWKYSDLYVSVHSGSLNLQSLLSLTSEIEDLLETQAADLDSHAIIEIRIEQLLSEIQKTLRSSQTCFDDSVILISKLTKRSLSISKISPPSLQNLEEAPKEDGELNHPAVDEVFELLVTEDNTDEKEDEDLEDLVDVVRLRREKEASEKVLQELKGVLSKKAEEWKEREKKAMESKGLVYKMEDDEISREHVSNKSKESNDLAGFDLLETNSSWPLPRLKGNIQNSRKRSGNFSHVNSRESGEPLKSVTSKICSNSEEKIAYLAAIAAASKHPFSRRSEDVYGSLSDSSSDELEIEDSKYSGTSL